MDSDALYWDPYDARFAAGPWPLFNRIREEAPLLIMEDPPIHNVHRQLQQTSSVCGWEKLPLVVG